MLYGLGLVFILGFGASFLFQKLRLPGLVGMVVVGILLGPSVLNILPKELLAISSDLRKIALVVVLTRSGLNLDLSALKKSGMGAILLCFLPATFEMVGVGIATKYLLGLDFIESFLLGAVLAAVSPAVVSPRMIRLTEEGYGQKNAVPQMVLAGSSVDDIFVIVAFYAFLGLAQGGADAQNTALAFLNVPLSMLTGIALGIALGAAFALLLKVTFFPLSIKVVLLLGLSFLTLWVEELIKPWVPFSALLCILVMGMSVLFMDKTQGKELSKGYASLWSGFEILLFVLVGAEVKLSYAVSFGAMPIAVLCIGLAVRSLGTALATLGTKLNHKERLFAIISYLPKATVQASIGGIALSAGLDCGAMVLTLSVLSILITAPLGAILIDLLGRKLLKKGE